MFLLKDKEVNLSFMSLLVGLYQYNVLILLRKAENDKAEKALQATNSL